MRFSCSVYSLGLYLLPLQLLPLPDELQQQASSLQVVAETVPLLQLLLQRLVRLRPFLHTNRLVSAIHKLKNSVSMAGSE